MEKLSRYKDPEFSVSVYGQLIQIAQKMGYIPLKPHPDSKEKIENLFDSFDKIILFLDTELRGWALSPDADELIDKIIKTLFEFKRERLWTDKANELRLSLTILIQRLWIKEEMEEFREKPIGIKEFFQLGVQEWLWRKGSLNARKLEFPIYEIALKDLPNEADGVAIVNFADLHSTDGFLQNPINLSYLKSCIQKLRDTLETRNISEEKIIVLLTGDMFGESSSDKNILRVAEILGSLPGKKFFVLGNHDVLHQHTELIVEALKQVGGIQNISKVSENFSGFKIQGIPDFTTQKEDITSELLSSISHFEGDEYQLLVTHNLEALKEIIPYLKRSIIVSGHTHGGQIVLPSAGDRINRIISNTLKKHPYKAPVFQGIKEIQEGVFVLVSRGIGCVAYPIRFGSIPEIPIIFLKKKEE